MPFYFSNLILQLAIQKRRCDKNHVTPSYSDSFNVSVATSDTRCSRSSFFGNKWKFLEVDHFRHSLYSK